MKKTIFTVILIAYVSFSFAQVSLTIKQYNELRNEIDSLQTGWKQERSAFTTKIIRLAKEIDSLKSHSQNIQKENNSLFTEKSNLLDTIKSLNMIADSVALGKEGSRTRVEDIQVKLQEKEAQLTSLKKEKEENEKTHLITGSKVF